MNLSLPQAGVVQSPDRSFALRFGGIFDQCKTFGPALCVLHDVAEFDITGLAHVVLQVLPAYPEVEISHPHHWASTRSSAVPWATAIITSPPRALFISLVRLVLHVTRRRLLVRVRIGTGPRSLPCPHRFKFAPVLPQASGLAFKDHAVELHAGLGGVCAALKLNNPKGFILDLYDVCIHDPISPEEILQLPPGEANGKILREEAPILILLCFSCPLWTLSAA
mmetsp:Transcript_77585/g.153908  ORF Transcript_77585/g.153908 Transcript_77585/m.153908 type:complete len:223 (+) Transcript_77585:119-787(+)